MKKMKIVLLFCLFVISLAPVSGQLKQSPKPKKRSLESRLLADDDTLTLNDYLLSIGRVFQLVDKASALQGPVPLIQSMEKQMEEDDSTISIIRGRLANKERALNVRNLQMYYILLDQIKADSKSYSRDLNRYDSTLDKTKKDLHDVKKDSVFRLLLQDSAVKETLKPELEDLRDKWADADTLIKHTNVLIDNTLARSSDNMIKAEELQLETSHLQATAGFRSFTKERRYLWEPRPPAVNGAAKFDNTLATERKITQAYFSHTNYQFSYLVLTAIVFFVWVFRNFRTLHKLNKLSAIDTFHFRYIRSIPVFPSLIFMLSLAPLFDINAPAVYVEFIEFLLLVVLTLMLYRRLPLNIYLLWWAFIVLFLLSFSNYVGLPFYINRWLLFCLNSSSLLLGTVVLWRMNKRYATHKILYWSGILYTVFNGLAVVCNLFGRVTLMQIFSTTATYALVQTVALLIFKSEVIEAMLLQIQTSRVSKEYPEVFDYAPVVKGIAWMAGTSCVIIWLIVFATDLNLFNSFLHSVSGFLEMPRIIGNFNFTYGGVILFLAILWIANFLQKYIAYFFGDIGDDASLNAKGHRSRLLITRLILIIGGFLLAVAASGLPVDRITVILGALGVGIGLGLQTIVNNFVSGIILIFDRTLRIGDTVEIGDKKGRVKEISVRSSTLLTPDGAEVIIPNGDILSHNIVNWTLSNNNIRIELSFTIDKLVGFNDIMPIAKEVLQSLPETLSTKDPDLFFSSITSQATQFKVYFWCKDVTKTELARSEVYAQFYKKLEEKGIKILS